VAIVEIMPSNTLLVLWAKSTETGYLLIQKSSSNDFGLSLLEQDGRSTRPEPLNDRQNPLRKFLEQTVRTDQGRYKA
jgi:hypothetical protein